MTEKKTFSVQPGLSLVLENLRSVKIIQGANGSAEVEITGDDKLVQDIKIEYSGNQLTIRDENKESINLSSSRSSGIVINGMSVNVVGGRVLINGREISGFGFKTREIPKVTVTVPFGTDLEIDYVNKTNSIGLGGKVKVRLSGQGQANIVTGKDPIVKCSGQSFCKISDVAGTLKATASGQSAIEISGSLEDVEAESSGQSEIKIVGDCRNFDGESSGQSEIILKGSISGRTRKRSHGQSEIAIR